MLLVTRWFFSQDSVVPNKSTIQRLVERLRETRSNGEKRRSGRPSVLSNDSLGDIRAYLLQSPRKSLTKLSQQTGMTYDPYKRLQKVSNCPWVA
jgi:transposase